MGEMGSARRKVTPYDQKTNRRAGKTVETSP